jgi:hypothetical protein
VGGLEVKYVSSKTAVWLLIICRAAVDGFGIRVFLGLAKILERSSLGYLQAQTSTFESSVLLTIIGHQSAFCKSLFCTGGQLRAFVFKWELALRLPTSTIHVGRIADALLQLNYFSHVHVLDLAWRI